MNSKVDLIDSLYKIMCSATNSIADSRVENNDYFKRRVLGFRAEIEFEQFINSYDRSNTNFLEGGQFISKKLSGDPTTRNSFIYTTVSSDDPSIYEKVYQKISLWNEVTNLIYIKIINSTWSTEMFEIKNETDKKENVNILKPEFQFYIFDKSAGHFINAPTQNFDIILAHFNRPTRKPSLFKLRKRDQFEYFSLYDNKLLEKIYANRYFLDVILRQAQGRNVIDLDGFIVKNDAITLVEIKEKTPITNDLTDQTRWQYGWDSRRILWYLYLLKTIEFPILYNVRQIDNRTDRKFIQWDSIFIDAFLKGISWSNSRGGGGGEDTLLAPYLFFKRLPEILNQL